MAMKRKLSIEAQHTADYLHAAYYGGQNSSEMSEMLDLLKECLLLFSKIDQFDKRGKSYLHAEDIQKLNDLPVKIRAMLAKFATTKAGASC